MLHLIPVRTLLIVVIVIAALGPLAGTYLGIFGNGDFLNDVVRVARWSPLFATFLLLSSYSTWRWIPLFQKFTYPYLGGSWSGQLSYKTAHGEEGTRPIDLEVDHNIRKAKFVLNSKESKSRTLLVHFVHDTGVNEKKIYYVYQNERKEGVPGAGEKSRGVAFMRIGEERTLTLHGSFFTDKESHGTLKLELKRHHKWWRFWR